MKRQVLVISFLFPPENDIGAVRQGKVCKYLREFDWEPTVLTTEINPTAHNSLSIEIENDKIIRVPSFALKDLFNELFRIKVNDKKKNQSDSSNKTENSDKTKSHKLELLNPLLEMPVISEGLFEPWGWCHYALKRGEELVLKNNIDVVFSTYSPLVNHVVASRLCRKTRLPWVAEFRDPWSINPYFRKPQPLFFIEKQWEKELMKETSSLIAVSQTWARRIEKLHAKKVMVVTNGFDEEDYINKVKQLDKFTITYTGSIYPNKRDPTPLLQAITNLKRKGRVSPGELNVRFYGENVKRTISPLIEKFGLREFVNCYEPITFKDSITRQKESTALLLLSWNDPRDEGTLTAKIFEYMGANRPILAHAYRHGEIEKRLCETGCGVVANDAEEIEKILLQWLNEFVNLNKIASNYHPDKELIKRYTRREQTRKLAQIFNAVTKEDNIRAESNKH